MGNNRITSPSKIFLQDLRLYIGILRLCWASFYYTARLFVLFCFCQLKARPSPEKNCNSLYCNTCFIMVVWNGTLNISEVCQYVEFVFYDNTFPLSNSLSIGTFYLFFMLFCVSIYVCGKYSGFRKEMCDNCRIHILILLSKHFYSLFNLSEKILIW